jgi:hypothetical protein
MPAAAKSCGACGAAGQYGAFCEECGATLPPAAAATYVITAERRTLDRGLADTEDMPGTPPSDEWHERARPLIVPVTEAAALDRAARPAAPVLPGIPEPARPVVRMPDPDDVTGGRPCPWCSALNPVDRHYCRRCALLLAAQPGPVRRPWWRRLLDWRRREVPYAGQRPRLRRGLGHLIRWAVMLVIVGVVAFAADTWGGAGVTNVEDHFAHPSVIFASSFTASHSGPGHPVAKLHDGYNNTWWGTGETGDGSGVNVDATFAQPIDLLDLIITPGAGVAQDAFTAESAPQTIKVTLETADGGSTSTTLSLPDSPGPETFAVHGSDVTNIRFTLESAYQASTGPGVQVAIAEIAFYEKS